MCDILRTGRDIAGTVPAQQTSAQPKNNLKVREMMLKKLRGTLRLFLSEMTNLENLERTVLHIVDCA